MVVFCIVPIADHDARNARTATLGSSGLDVGRPSDGLAALLGAKLGAEATAPPTGRKRVSTLQATEEFPWRFPCCGLRKGFFTWQC